MSTSDEHPRPDKLEQAALLELPCVLQTQSMVIGCPGHKTSVKTRPDSLRYDNFVGSSILFDRSDGGIGAHGLLFAIVNRT